MPRNGSGIYFRPPGIDGIPDHSIESAKYNLNVADVETDLNTVRPIVAGGTGASNAHDAMVALGGEFAGQQVTNYDVFPFLAGSFWSAPGATSEPFPGSYTAGIAYIVGASIFLEAREVGPPAPSPVKVRQKNAGTWGTWTFDLQDMIAVDTGKVSKAGDVMSGDLIINKTNPTLLLNKLSGAGADHCDIVSEVGGSARWSLRLGNETAESATSTGSDVALLRFNNGGVFIDTPLQVLRQDGRILSLGLAPIYANELITKSYVDTGAGAKVSKAGDSMSGNLTVSKDGPQVILDTTTANPAVVSFQHGAVARWSVYMGGDAAGDYFVRRYNDAGVSLGDALQVSRNSGLVTVGNLACTSIAATSNVVAGGNIQASGGSYFFQTTANALTYNSGTSIFGLSGNLNVNGYVAATILRAVNGAIYTDSDSNPGYFFRDAAGTQKGAIYWGSSDATLRLNIGAAPVEFVFKADGMVTLGSGFTGRKGKTTPGTADGNAHNFYWNATTIEMWIDNTNLGNVAVTCDYRIKKDVVPLPSTWEQVKALKPIAYTQAQFTPPSSLAMHVEERARAAEEDIPPPDVPAPMFAADDILRWGFLAHELQETLLPTAATGTKDAPDIVQSPNLLPIVAALTKCIQEAQIRIEGLEERLALAEGRSRP